MKTIFVMVKCDLGKAYAVADAAVGEIEQVSEVYSTSGQYDLLMKCYLPDSDRYRPFRDRAAADACPASRTRSRSSPSRRSRPIRRCESSAWIHGRRIATGPPFRLAEERPPLSSHGRLSGAAAAQGARIGRHSRCDRSASSISAAAIARVSASLRFFAASSVSSTATRAPGPSARLTKSIVMASSSKA